MFWFGLRYNLIEGNIFYLYVRRRSRTLGENGGKTFKKSITFGLVQFKEAFYKKYFPKSIRCQKEVVELT